MIFACIDRGVRGLNTPMPKTPVLTPSCNAKQAKPAELLSEKAQNEAEVAGHRMTMPRPITAC